VSFVRLYQGGKTTAAAKVKLEIRDSNDRAVFEDSELIEGAEFQVMQRRHADYRVQLPINELAPGPYLLTIEANAAGKSVRRDVRFVIQ
jgi:hypothetical protein